MDLRDHITALAATADRIGLGYSRDAARAVHHHVDELRDALDEHALKVTAAIREAHAAKDVEIERLKAELQDAERRIDRQVKRGDRLTEWVRDVRLLHTQGPRTDTCNECGVTWPCSTFEALT